MNLLRRVRAWRAARKADREAIAQAHGQARRAGDEEPPSPSETVDDVAGTYPPPS